MRLRICSLFFQIIKEPTRMSTNSSSTIDLILVSDEDKISKTGVLYLGISDHSLIYCTRRVVKAAINKHNTVKLRSMKNYDKDTFQVNLLNADWSSVLISDNACDAWEKFKSNFTSLVDDIAPIKEVRIKQRTEPWVNDEILQSIKDRDKAFETFKNDRSDEKFTVFKQLRNKTQTLIYNAKKNFFKDKLKHENNDSKSLWNSPKQLGMPSKKGKKEDGK